MSEQRLLAETKILSRSRNSESCRCSDLYIDIQKYRRLVGTCTQTLLNLPANMQRYPHCVVMEHDELGVIIVPDLGLRALSQISIKEIVKAILDADTDIQGLHLHMRPLCEAIIRRIYHFEDATSQQSKLGARELGRPRSRATSKACKVNSLQSPPCRPKRQLQLTKLATSASSTNARNTTTALHNTDVRSLLSEMSQVVENAGSSTGASMPRTLNLYYLKCRKSLRMQVLRREPPYQKRSTCTI